MAVMGWLQNWYQKNCDGAWEHLYGVKIDTLDNPGWSVRIDLQETALEKYEFKEFKYDYGENDWVFCTKKDCTFLGAGGVSKLEEILNIFRAWVEDQSIR